MYDLMLIGPCNNKKDKTETGGIVVSFETLLGYCSDRGISVCVVDTNKRNYQNILTAFFYIFIKILFMSFNCRHLSLHGTSRDYVFIGPVVMFTSMISRRRYSLRKFAGNFNIYYESSGPAVRYVIRKLLKNSSVNFFETKYLVDFFSCYNSNTFWFPNCRNKTEIRRRNGFAKKFVFISQLFKTKGVSELAAASEMLPEGYTVDIYGPLKDDYTEALFCGRAVYKGSLESCDVIRTLAMYDVLVFPTYFQGEGYPGVIIEALSVGLPVIVTPLAGIKEMVDDSCAVFVEPKSTEQLKNAMLFFNEDNYDLYSDNALITFEKFNSVNLLSMFIEKVRCLNN